MAKFLHRTAILLLLAFGNPAHADIAVLVHGYLADNTSWERSGINAQLIQAGWRHAGDIHYSPHGNIVYDLDRQAAENRFFSVKLPSLAPVAVQASWLKGALNSIERRYPEEAITLVGHSAGGVVARFVLVQYGAGNVDRLITIASPHLGTDKAVEALNATNGGGIFGFFKEQIVRNQLGDGLYNAVRHSRGILSDLVPPHPGSLLYWLNSQPHPDIRYVSIVRSAGYNIRGDLLVPPFSQDMNQIPVLAGKSQRYITIQGHELSPADGLLLVTLL